MARKKAAETENMGIDQATAGQGNIPAEEAVLGEGIRTEIQEVQEMENTEGTVLQPRTLSPARCSLDLPDVVFFP